MSIEDNKLNDQSSLPKEEKPEVVSSDFELSEL